MEKERPDEMEVAEKEDEKRKKKEKSKHQLKFLVSLALYISSLPVILPFNILCGR